MNPEYTSEQIALHFLELEWVLGRVERSSNHYQVLDLNRSANIEEINQAYRRDMTMLNRSDPRHRNLPDGVRARIKQAFDKISRAYAVLSNFGKRVEYDNSLVRKKSSPLSVEVPSTAQKNLGVEADLAIQTTSSSAEQQPAQVAVNDVISIKQRLSQQVAFTKPVEEGKERDRRKHKRFRLSIPTQVTGYDLQYKRWTEIAETLNVSMGGAALRMSKEVHVGMVLHLILPMPLKLRKHGYSAHSYPVYAIVRHVEFVESERRVVRLEFLKESPPPGYLTKPWATFQTEC